MKVLVTNKYDGAPVLWEYDEGIVERIDLVDFNTHTLLPDDTPSCFYPIDLAEKIIMYVYNRRVETRNFDQAMQIAFISRFFAKKIYNDIYKNKGTSVLFMLKRLGLTFRFAESIYDSLCVPTSTNGFIGIGSTRLGSLSHRRRFDPWDFFPRVHTDELFTLEEDNPDLFIFPGEFYGDTVWIRGRDLDGIYDVDYLQHPVIVLILRDYTDSLIPTPQTINPTWRSFANLLRKAFGPHTGVNIMVKENHDVDNPFINITTMFVQL